MLSLNTLPKDGAKCSERLEERLDDGKASGRVALVEKYGCASCADRHRCRMCTLPR